MTQTTTAWLCAVGALVAAVALWFPWLRAKISHRVFADVMLRILATGNLDRAKKLSSAAPASPFARAVGAALAELDNADGASPG